MRASVSGAAAVWSRLVLSLVVVASSASAVVLAVDKDKARYLGGSSSGFPKGGLIGGGGTIRKIEGRLDLRSESHFAFDAGRAGSLEIPYRTITSLAYGLAVHAPGSGQGGLTVWPWDPSDQFTDKPHYLLTLVYEDGTGVRHAAVFELGQEIERSTLEALEARTGKPITFPHVRACLRYASAERCDLGEPSELKGLRRVFIDTRRESNRALIVSEIQAGAPGLELLPNVDGAEVILTFEEGSSHLRPVHAGRGEVYVVRDGRRRPVMVFAKRLTGALFGRDKPATTFGKTFIEAYRQAGGGM